VLGERAWEAEKAFNEAETRFFAWREKFKKGNTR
jgi:hypothetical protein